MRKFFAAIITAMVAVWGYVPAASASIIFDNNTTTQSVTATSGPSSLSSTLTGPVAGVASIFSDRTLSAHLTSALGQVEAAIGSGQAECNRTVDATGYCQLSYLLTETISFSSLEYGAVNDGAFSGGASIGFFKNGISIGSQVISVGSAVYTTMLTGADFVSGDQFRVLLYGDIAVDQALRPIEGNKVSAPGTIALLGLGTLGMAGFRRRRA